MNPSPLFTLKAKLLVGPVFGGMGALFEAGNIHAWIPLLCIVAGFLGSGLFQMLGKWYDRRAKRQDDSQANLLRLKDSRDGKDIRIYELDFYDRAALEAKVERYMGVSFSLLEKQLNESKCENTGLESKLETTTAKLEAALARIAELERK